MSHFFLNPQLRKSKKETYGLLTSQDTPNVPLLKEIEKKVISMISNLKFRDRSKLPQHQKNLLAEVEQIKEKPKVLVPADKTSSYYKVDTQEYIKMREKTVHKDYKVARPNQEQKITRDHNVLTKDLELEDRLEVRVHCMEQK